MKTQKTGEMATRNTSTDRKGKLCFEMKFSQVRFIVYILYRIKTI